MTINPNDSFKASITRIFHTNGAVVGAGFLVSGQYVLTCAHVVTAALGISGNITEAPTGSIDLDFPLVAPGQKIKAQVVFWQPMNPLAVGEDIAGLRLEGVLPNDAQPVQLVTADELWAHPIRIFGFPSGHNNGVWASGVLRDKLANSWVQIEDDKVPGLRVERGFSGAPVWDETLAGVVGMTVAAETQRQEGKVAFIIPTKVLNQAWSILGQSLDVGGKQPNEKTERVMSTARKLQIERLERKLEKLKKDYRDVGEKEQREGNPQERNNLELQLQSIADQMGEIEQQLNELKDGNEYS
ncbi:MAG TPA: serine protease [Cyanobacteria bacterium UBA8803]|nr:serine protease [Cyanobacteria bacterium UBA9273]HBL61314.1 serine protease [Cyanobacteria bacterium UBA8803]